MVLLIALAIACSLFGLAALVAFVLGHDEVIPHCADGLVVVVILIVVLALLVQWPHCGH
jgi:hypothetical protein